MPELMRLTRGQKNKDVFTAEFSDGARLRVCVAQIADYGLYAGRVLDAPEYEALRASVSAESARTRALRILGSRMLSRRDLIDRLVQKGETDADAQEAADWLEGIGAINDGEYASAIVRHYAARGYGRRRVQDELYRRGIDRQLWEEALEALPDMDDKALDALRKRLGGARPDKDTLRRATGALYRRGFTWEEINTAVTTYMNEEQPTDE